MVACPPADQGIGSPRPPRFGSRHDQEHKMHGVNDQIGRRAFLNATGASTLLLVSTPACQGAVARAPSTQATEAPSTVAVSRAPSSAQSKLFVCDMCGHVEFGAAPE